MKVAIGATIEENADRAFTLRELLQAIVDERERQTVLQAAGRFKHTAFSSALSQAERLAILGEEFGEVSRAVLKLTELANDIRGKSLRTELIQLAAVALAWLEYLHDA